MPLMFGWTSYDAIRKFLVGPGKHEKIEFGARQAVLVLNEAAKARLPAELRTGSVVHTVFEAKGLEFDDVLLYNFFADSEASREDWRALLEGGEGGDDVDALPAARARRFDSVKHKVRRARLCVGRRRAWFCVGGGRSCPEWQWGVRSGLRERRGARASGFALLILGISNSSVLNVSMQQLMLSELRFFYTAITRARANIYIFGACRSIVLFPYLFQETLYLTYRTPSLLIS